MDLLFDLKNMAVGKDALRLLIAHIICFFPTANTNSRHKSRYWIFCYTTFTVLFFL